MVQNAAARLLTGAKKHDHITPILASLHWLPVSFRIQFKILLIVFKAHNGQAPSYISDLISFKSTSKPLRSANKALLYVPRSRLKFKGDRAFAVAAPRLWNQLPRFLKVQGSLLFVTYIIIQGIIGSEMLIRTGPLNGKCKKIK